MISLYKQVNGTTKGGGVQCKRGGSPSANVMGGHGSDVVHLVEEEGGEGGGVVAVQ